MKAKTVAAMDGLFGLISLVASIWHYLSGDIERAQFWVLFAILCQIPSSSFLCRLTAEGNNDRG
jgi:hypothetical protein